MSIERVAKLAGVSRMTVSRVLTSSGGVKEQTKKRVQTAMQKLNYVPSAAARALRSGDNLRATGALCFAIIFGIDTQVSDGFFCNVARGAEEAAVEHGLCPLQVHSQESLIQSWKRLQVALSIPGLCGALMCGEFKQEEVVALQQHLENIVIVDSPAPASLKVGSVEADNLGGCMIALEYLIEQKVERLLVLGGKEGHYFTKATQMAVESCCDKFQKVHFSGAAFTNESGYIAVKELFADHIPFDGIFGNDEQCIGALRALADLNIQVPQQVRVIGFDDIPHACYTYPRLTSVSIDKTQLGRQAVQMLVEMIRNNNEAAQVKRIVRAKLVIRNSA